MLGQAAADLTYKDIIDKPAHYCAQCLFSGGKWEWAAGEPEGACRYKNGSLKKDTKLTDTIVPASHLSYKKMFEGLAHCKSTPHATTDLGSHTKKS